MRRLFYKGELAKEIEITGTDAHHLMHVLRARAGDEMVVVDDRNRTARMEMVGFTGEAVTMRLKERLEMDTESPADITLAQCLLKADKMDFVVQGRGAWGKAGRAHHVPELRGALRCKKEGGTTEPLAEDRR